MSQDEKSSGLGLAILVVLVIGLGLGLVLIMGWSSPPITPRAERGSASSQTPGPAPVKAPPVPPMPQIDFRDYVQAPGSLRIGKGAKVGHGTVTRTEAAGTTVEILTAIVAETEDAWQVETTQTIAYMPQLQGYRVGMVVNKADGKVLEAFCGKPGEGVKDIKINPVLPIPEPPEGTETEVTLSTAAGGPHKAKLFEKDGYKSWTGVEGELKDVPLKFEAAQTSYELEKLPEDAEMDIGGVAVAIKKFILSNDSEFWTTEHPAIAALNPYLEGRGLAASVGPSYNIKIIKVATDHKPTLDWP